MIPQLFATGEELRIGQAGIRWVRWSEQMIPWSEIADVTTFIQSNDKWIVLHLRQPALYPGRGILGRLARANRSMTGGDISFSLADTNRSFEEAMAAIARYRNREHSI